MCGLWGVINYKERPFDYSTFCTLGINNDSRGGDSCGIFIDGKYEYGVDKKKFFANFFEESELLSKTKECTIALGHCRKASIGKIDESTAQPVILFNEKKEVEFVVLHNGTIYNYEELAKKYIPDVDIKDMTDSQVMARIFYYKGYDVLAEYNGGAVFFIVDYREKEPRILMFKGASKKYKSDKEDSEERPLYFCQMQTRLVFSSIPTYLTACCKGYTVYTPTNNTLVELKKDGKLYVVESIDRSNVLQTRNIVYQSYYNHDEYKYPDYIHATEFNTYNLDGKALMGKYMISEYGMVNSKTSPSKEMWFFNGVPMMDEKSYKFINKFFKKSKVKDIDIFTIYFENVIRFLSRDQLYNLNGFMVKAISPASYNYYTGKAMRVGSNGIYTYENGRQIGNVSYCYGAGAEKIEYPVRELNYDEIEKVCKRSMNLME